MPKLLEYNATLVERIDLTSKLAIFKVRPDEPYQGAVPWFDSPSRSATAEQPRRLAVPAPAPSGPGGRPKPARSWAGR